jgi:RNA polymerase sigma factor (sigma-70 family)
MSIVHPLDLRGPAIFRCAQAGCAECVDRLLRQHEGLVHAVLRRQACGDAVYADLLQEGRLGLWQAVLHFDPGRGVAFSTYAGVAIERRVWRAVARSRDQPVGWEGAAPVEPEAAAEVAWQRAQVQIALPGALRHLPERLRRVLLAAYGLRGKAPRSLAAIGREYGVSRERVRQWRNEALVVLRLPAVSGRLRQVYGQDDRAAYQRADRLNRAGRTSRRRGGSS